MKFGYSYKTPDGVRHEEVFEARTKEDVFRALRARKIRPIKVWPLEKPVSKRNIVIAALALALAAALACVYRESRAPAESLTAARHQIYGDPVIVDELLTDGLRTAFPDEGERFLAMYAIPGRVSSSASSLLRPILIAALRKCLAHEIPVSASDSRELSELKAIVRGMKRELREYVADGTSFDAYLDALEARQAEEASIYERTCNELAEIDDPKIRAKRNAQLREMGLRAVPRRPRK